MRRFIVTTLAVILMWLFTTTGAWAWPTWTIQFYERVNGKVEIIKEVTTREHPWAGKRCFYWRGKDGLSIEAFCPTQDQWVEYKRSRT